MTCQDSFHEVAFNISFWTRNISSARILFWRGVSKMLIFFSVTIITAGIDLMPFRAMLVHYVVQQRPVRFFLAPKKSGILDETKHENHE